MASALHFIVLLCGLWIGADVLQPVEAKCTKQTVECCETVTCPPGWTDFGLRCYLFNKDEKDWADAEVLYVGASDQVKEGVWLWSDGSKFVFNGWAKGQPDNTGGEGCMDINYSGRDYVNDAICSLKKSVVCAKDL
ncbi:galactose-specific lectin nattectin-like [Morone saxatilis]|uniref:galactose-specific lectin nattectin-like n=1 Tax=Morone saxatilis TaxID=34816 RepID=UPI0015E25614|nr:galactose-specific lectin nattectin-like [Morone saxatilis]